jgi:hypothetical protein
MDVQPPLDSSQSKSVEPPPAPRFFTILVGLISGAIGLGLLCLVGWMAVVSIQKMDLPNTPLLVMFAIMAGVGAFMALVSYRLLTNRGASVGGGLLSPTGWRVMGSIFVGISVFLAGAVWRSESFSVKALSPILFGITFAGWCFMTARKLSKTRWE